MNTQIKTSSLAARITGFLFVMVLLSGLIPSQTWAQDVPPAGTLIGNQATATYTDPGGNERTVTSNVVNTQVQQVASVSITAPQSRQVSPGGQLSFPHTIQNTGNGADVFDITTNQPGSGTDDFDFQSVSVYADANGDGVPDDFNNITETPSIAAGASFSVVVVVNVPNSATGGQTAQLGVTATSQFDNGVSDNLTDEATVSENAVLNVSKTMSNNSGLPDSGPYTVTLTYTNTGNTAATDFYLGDALPSEFEYQAGSGRWSVSGSGPANALTDADDGSEGVNTNIEYKFVGASDSVVAVISSVAPGQSGTLTFDVRVPDGTAPGIVENTANYYYNDGSGKTDEFFSNTYNFTVLEDFAVSGTGETINDATQGATVTFDNVITNDGNATDRFNVSIASNSFPSGTSYILYKTDGNSPLLDTNNDGVPDTGPIAPGGSYTVKLKVTLPSNISGGGPYVIQKRARSVSDPNEETLIPDELTTITGNTVDLTAVAEVTNGSSLGDGAGPEADTVKAEAADPGNTVSFDLYVNNTSTVSDNFDLIISTDETFGSISLPSGVAVSFKDQSGSVITNTGTINAGSSKQITMEITLPEDAPAGLNSYYVRSLSPSTTAEDIIHLGVITNTVRDISISPNNSGQIYPGGSVVYTHTIINNGNVAEDDGSSTIELTHTNSNSGFNSVVYLDSDGDGEIDTGEPIIDQVSDLGTFQPGDEKQVIVKVTATPGVTEGLNNTTTVTLSITGTIDGVAAPADVDANDVTTVITSNVALVKKQSLDANGDGTADNSYSTGNVQAIPGQGVMYEIKVTNLGTEAVDDVSINDAIPPYTSYNQANAVVTTTKGTANYDGPSETITVDIGTMAPGEEVTITFGVLIND